MRARRCGFMGCPCPGEEGETKGGEGRGREEDGEGGGEKRGERGRGEE